MFGISDFYWILINSAFAFVFLFIISKILGKKQIAQLEFIDYVVGISLGSIAADWATETSDKPFYYYLTSMAMFFLLAFACDFIGRKGAFMKHIFKGKPSALIYEGKINSQQLSRCKLDINDLLSMLRDKGYFDINDVAYAIFETSGKLSVLPKGSQRPVVIEDVNKKAVEQASLTNVLIVDGKISKSGLSEVDRDKAWLFKKLKIKDKRDIKNILLAIYDGQTDSFGLHYKKQE